MNKLIISNVPNNYGEYKEKLGILDNISFNAFLKALERNDAQRNCGGMIETDSCRKIAETLRCFEIEFADYHDVMIIDDLSVINNQVFHGEKSNMEILLWVSKGIVETIADKIDENIRYGSFIDNEFLCNVRDWFLYMYLVVKDYEVSRA